MEELVLVEPINRGSRLQNLYYYIDLFCDQYARIHLITRKEYGTEHFNELIAQRDYSNLEIHGIDLNIGDTWMTNLGFRQTFRLLQYCNRLAKKRASQANQVTLFFCAIDDYYKYFAIQAFFRKPGIKYKYLRYRANSLFERDEKIRQRIKYSIQNLILKSVLRKEDRLLIMDERFLDSGCKIFEKYVKVIPELWEGDFGHLEKEDARKRLTLPLGKKIILTLGKQDQRKGLIDLMCFLEDEKSEEYILLVIGRIEEDIKVVFNKKMSNEFLQKKIIHVNSFVSEEDLHLYYDACDMVALPYWKKFKFTSGVLTRAVASNKPVIASDHGLVGWRTKKYRLGEIYPANNISKLSIGVKEIAENPGKYQKSNVLNMPLMKGNINHYRPKLSQILK